MPHAYSGPLPRVAIVLALVPFALALGCGEGMTAKPKPPLEVGVKVTSDPGQALEKAEVQFNGKTIATTDADGLAKLVLSGNEGDSYEVTIKCPAGFQSPQKSLVIPLRRLADPSRPPEYEVSCPPTKRTVVVAVRAENGPNLPVMHLGRAVGRTDASGAATILLKGLDADAQFELMIDTTEKGNEQLRPQNPSSTFMVKNADDVITYDIKFSIEAKAKVYGPARVGPIKLGSGK